METAQGGSHFLIVDRSPYNCFKILTNKVLALDTASLACVPSLHNPETGVTLKSGQRMLFLLFLQDSYSQYPSPPPFYFIAGFTSWLTGASGFVCSLGDL